MRLFRKRSHLRTIILAIAAAGAFVYAAIFSFDIDPAVMFRLFVLSGAMLLVAIGAAAIAATIWVLVRRRCRS